MYLYSYKAIVYGRTYNKFLRPLSWPINYFILVCDLIDAIWLLESTIVRHNAAQKQFIDFELKRSS